MEKSSISEKFNLMEKEISSLKDANKNLIMKFQSNQIAMADLQDSMLQLKKEN